MNRERRSKCHHEISLPRGFTSALQSEGIEILSETNGRRLQVSAAFAERRLAMNSKMFKMGLRVATPKTSLTFHKEVCAVQLDQAAAIRTRKSVQPIDILSQHGTHFARIFQGDDGMVNRVWSRRAKCRPCLEFIIPVLDSS